MNLLLVIGRRRQPKRRFSSIINQTRNLHFIHSSFGILILHLFNFCIFFYFTNYVNAINYWRRLGPLSPDLKLGTHCRSSLECLLFVPHSHCDWDKRVCTCQPYHVLYNETMCLPPQLLGYACSITEQCTVKVANSECLNGVCRCKSNFLPLRKDKCLPPAHPEEFCLNDRQCHLGSEYSYCKFIIPRIYGKCRCENGYQLTNDKKCLPKLHNKCQYSSDCNQIVQNSQCIHYLNGTSFCQCQAGFAESEDRMSCVLEQTTEIIQQILQTEINDDEFNTIDDIVQEDEPQKFNFTRGASLGFKCSQDSDCKLRDPHSQCVNGICDCIKSSSQCNLKNRGCYNDTFQCRNGQCISWYFVCDSKNNCYDGSDEDICQPFNCPKEAFQCKSDGKCLPKNFKCNGKVDCPNDDSDESDCDFFKLSCDKQIQKCDSGYCLPRYSMCCLNGSEKEEEICDQSKICPNGTHTCENGSCRSTAVLCSGVDGCGDNTDEEKCEICYCEKP